MPITTKSILTLLAMLSLSLSAYGDIKCAKLFSDDAFNIVQPSGVHVIDKVKLKENGFALNKNRTLIDLLASKNERRNLGEISIDNPKNLYQWADIKDYQEVWVANGGISLAEMRAILNEPSQAFGKGYYVSKDPFDSSSYGGGLTVFKPVGPMIRVQAFMGTTEQMMRLQKIGIDALVAGGQWLSVIGSKHLKVVKDQQITDPYWDDLANLNKVIEHDQKLVNSNFWRWLPEDNIYRKLRTSPQKHADEIYNKLTPYVIQRLQLKSNIPTNQLHTNIKSILKEEALKTDFKTDTEERIKKALLIQTVTGTAYRSKKRNSKFSQVLKYIDLESLSRFFNGEKLKETSSIEGIFKFVEAAAEGRQLVDILKIKSADDFIEAVEKVTSKRIIIRNDERIMTAENDLENISLKLTKTMYYHVGSNAFLSQRIIKQNKSPKGTPIVHAEVDYVNFKTLYNFKSVLPLTPEFRDYLTNNGETILRNPGSAIYKSTFRKLQRALLENFFHADGRKHLLSLCHRRIGETNKLKNPAMALYILFMSLHPFNDGNGRAGRLMYEYLSHAMNGKSEELILPVYDLDLLADPKKLETMQAIGQNFKKILNDTDDIHEFKYLINIFKNFFYEHYPEYEIL